MIRSTLISDCVYRPAHNRAGHLWTGVYIPGPVYCATTRHQVIEVVSWSVVFLTYKGRLCQVFPNDQTQQEALRGMFGRNGSSTRISRAVALFSARSLHIRFVTGYGGSSSRGKKCLSGEGSWEEVDHGPSSAHCEI